MKRLFVALCGAWMAGCATMPVVAPPMPVRTIPLGLNDGYHGPLPPDIAQLYCGLKPHTLIRTPQVSTEALSTFLTSVQPCVAAEDVVALVENPDVMLAKRIASSGYVGMIELGNELELAPNNLSVVQYGQWIHEAYAAIRSVNPTITIITGGVFTLNADTQPYLLAARTNCPGCVIGVHLYEDLTSSDLAFLETLGQVAVTETGAPTRCQGPEGQATWITSRINLLSTVKSVQMVLVYQRPTGPTCSDLDTFGLQAPALELLK